MAGPGGDPAVDEAYDGFGVTWRLYAEAYARDSLDGNGLPAAMRIASRTL